MPGGSDYAETGLSGGSSDRFMIADCWCLLDNRILKKQYGKVFIESLPNYRKTTDWKQVEEFFGVSDA